MIGLLGFWRRFRRNIAAVIGLVFLTLIVAVALFGPILYPVDPYDMIGRPSQPPSARFPPHFSSAPSSRPISMYLSTVLN